MDTKKYIEKVLQTTRELESLDFFMGKAIFTKTEFRLLQEVVNERRAGRNIISSEIARRLGLTRSAISQIVTKLERMNVVRRIPSGTDRKAVYVCLSDRAAEMVDRECRRACRVMERVVEEYGEERMDRLISEYDALFAVYERVNKEFSETSEGERKS